MLIYKSRKWSSYDDAAVIRLFNEKRSIKYIAGFLNRSYSSVKNRINKLGLFYKTPFTESEKSFFISSAGYISCTEMARISGRSLHGISSFLIRNGVSCKLYGDNNHRTVYSDSDVLLMRQLYDEGLSISDIADKFDCSFSTAKNLSLPSSPRRVASDYYFLHKFD